MGCRLRWVVYAILVAQALCDIGLGLSLHLIVFIPFENSGLAYAQSAWIYGAYGILSSIVYFASSVYLDQLPTLRVGIVALVVGALTRALLFVPWVSASATMATILLTSVLSVSDTLAGAALYLTFQRLLRVDMIDECGASSHEHLRMQRRLLYVMYGTGNIMAIVSDLVYDALRHPQWHLQDSTTNAAILAHANRHAAMLSAIAMVLAALVLLAAQACVRVADRAPAVDNVTLGARPWTAALRDPSFRRFFALCMALIGVHALCRNFDTTLALFMLRSYGAEAHFSLIQLVNPAGVILLLPLVVWTLDKVGDYTLFVAGTVVSSLAPLALAFWIYAYSGAADNVLYGALVGMVFLFTVGECLWSPRLPNYALAQSPTGGTALFLATSTVPMLLSKVVATVQTSWLVPTFCDEVSMTCNGVVLWTVLGLVSATSPLILLAAQTYLSPPEAEAEAAAEERGRL